MPELDGHDWVDCALFLMFAHAHMTDWELSEEELEVIEKKTETFVSHITGEGKIFTELYGAYQILMLIYIVEIRDYTS